MKKTKSALLLSAVSMLLCLSMLVGSTFAWFTDTASTGVNKIVAGNLDIELSYKNATMDEYEPVNENTTDLFVKAGATETDKEMLWEPGAVSVCYFKVENSGSLALKYQLSINIANEIVGKSVVKDADGEPLEIKLSEVLKFGVVESDEEITAYETREAAIDAVKATAGNLATKLVTGEMSKDADAKYYALVVYMPTSVGNEANHNGTDEPSIQLGVNVVATQKDFEEDSFGYDYDEKVTDLSVLTGEAAKDLEGTVAIGAQFYNLGTAGMTVGDENLINSKVDTLIFQGGVINSGYSSTDMNKDDACMNILVPKGAKVVMQDMTINGCFRFDNSYGQAGYVTHMENELVFENCTINGSWQGWVSDYKNITFKNCTFTTEGLNVGGFYSGNTHHAWFRSDQAGSVYTFDGCTFNGNRGIHIESTGAKVNVTGCTFNLSQHEVEANGDRVIAIKLGTAIASATISGNTMNSGTYFIENKGSANISASNNTLAGGVTEYKQ